MSQDFKHIVISTHQNVEMSRAETMYFFPKEKNCKKSVTYVQTDGQSLLEDASRIKNEYKLVDF